MTPHSIKNTLIRQGLVERKVHRLRYANFFKQPIHLHEYKNQLIITCFDLVAITVSFDRSLCFKNTRQNISTSIQKHPIKLLLKKHEHHDFSLIWTKNLIAKIPRCATPTATFAHHQHEKEHTYPSWIPFIRPLHQSKHWNLNK